MKIHIVKKGDSLYELSQKYNVELDKLIAANPQIQDPNVLDIGMKVKIPNTPKPIAPPTDYLYKHVVVQGDSIWKLGKAWGIPLTDMISANPQLKNPNVLMTGDVVYIPKLNPEPSQNPIPGVNPKADTSQIVPEAPLPVEAPLVSEQAVEQPNVAQAQAVPEQPNIGMQQVPIMEQPNVAQAQAVPEQPNIGMQQVPIMEQPNVAQAQAVPEQPNIGMQQVPIMEQPNVAQTQAFPQIPNVGMQQAPAMELSHVPQMPNVMPTLPSVGSNEHFGMHESFMPFHMASQPDWHTEGQAMGTGNLPPSMDLFQQYNVPAAEVMAYDTPSKGKGKENVWQQPELPSMPMMQSMQMPVMPNMPSVAEMPYFTPHAAYPAYPSMEGPLKGGDCGCGQPQLPYSMQMPTAESLPMMPNMPPSAEMPYFAPHAAYPAYPMMEGPLKGGDCGCGQPQLPYSMQMPTAESLPMMPNMPPSAEMPYFAPHAAYPAYPMMEGPFMGGDWGCGQPQLPYTMPMAAGYPVTEPFMPYPLVQHSMPMMPYGADGYPSYEQMAAVNSYPGISPFTSMAGPGSPFAMPYPWGAQEDCGYKDKHKSKGDKGKNREEEVVFSQTDAKTETKVSALAPKRKSARATISRLIERHVRKARKTEKVRKASPWMNH
ncbi:MULTISPECIES: LysM peptidoglycan-binding domain-containing protein [unclassified Paenibacillus]|uniref:LysM peptidoglycan-binding domain-containing protein n=1 Tax=unclassified Paenibacillus TaxID=185978 RepID=UPI001AE2B18E|nr:LysM repeat protein [Paenibacillus sp. PvP091]MBP1172698.1 LysM repeat protein [Paenibacillus sp. PvR098]MBP2439078.1 LysM repeat protein [Paenibacillus sp. PvP052]